MRPFGRNTTVRELASPSQLREPASSWNNGAMSDRERFRSGDLSPKRRSRSPRRRRRSRSRSRDRRGARQDRSADASQRRSSRWGGRDQTASTAAAPSASADRSQLTAAQGGSRNANKRAKDYSHLIDNSRRSDDRWGKPDEDEYVFSSVTICLLQ